MARSVFERLLEANFLAVCGTLIARPDFEVSHGPVCYRKFAFVRGWVPVGAGRFVGRHVVFGAEPPFRETVRVEVRTGDR